jgi:hypothetical protein
MTATEELLDCFAFFKIEVLEKKENHIALQKGYAIEVEANGLYKLSQDGEVIAPFDDLNELSHFILNS